MQKFMGVVLLAAAALIGGCAAKQPIAETPKRAELIEIIVAKSSMVRVTADSKRQPKTEEQLRQEAFASIDARKSVIKTETELPDDYWAGHEQNVYLFASEMNSIGPRALDLYKARYREPLAFATDEQLEQLATSSDMESTPTYQSLFGDKDLQLTLYYFQQSNRFTAVALDHHLTRMKELDRRFDACAVVKDCWK